VVITKIVSRHWYSHGSPISSDYLQITSTASQCHHVPLESHKSPPRTSEYATVNVVYSTNQWSITVWYFSNAAAGSHRGRGYYRVMGWGGWSYALPKNAAPLVIVHGSEHLRHFKLMADIFLGVSTSCKLRSIPIDWLLYHFECTMAKMFTGKMMVNYCMYVPCTRIFCRRRTCA
jgi:hypothetical protein